MSQTLPLRLLVAVLFSGLLASAAQAFQIQEVRSPGGISAWLVEEHAVPLIAMSYSFRGGTASELADKQGVTYFLSGMLDEGAGPLDSEAFRRRRDELSARIGFETSADYFSGS